MAAITEVGNATAVQQRLLKILAKKLYYNILNNHLEVIPKKVLEAINITLTRFRENKWQ
ncbi:hypothetical protein [Lacinutrix algicola]|uniref:hypothetical protein n=1 Tax=Lacinutrix algicola TaxID=342954 RepID=UPI000A7A47A1|nr:hypothetical protein [Lacinutrix algicola]